MIFEKYIGIDYSGGGRPDQPRPGIQVFEAKRDQPPDHIRNVINTKAKNWSRKDLCTWLITELARTDERMIIGIDHGFSFPLDVLQRYSRAGSWVAFLKTYIAVWQTDERTVEEARRDHSLAGYVEDLDPTALRLTEKWTSNAKSIFQFSGPGVAHSSHAGLPWLLEFRKSVPKDQIHFWPFDGFDIPESGSVVVEVYPAIFKHRYEEEFRERNYKNTTTDMWDAYSVCRWLQEMDDSDGRIEPYFRPPLTKKQNKTARVEGWILGVY